MPLVDYIPATPESDHFEAEKQYFSFPCCACKHRNHAANEEPCRTCTHNAAADRLVDED